MCANFVPLPCAWIVLHSFPILRLIASNVEKNTLVESSAGAAAGGTAGADVFCRLVDCGIVAVTA